MGRVEKMEWVPHSELQDMVDALKQTQRSAELRLNPRQAAAASVATLPYADNNGGSSSPPPAVRFSPSSAKKLIPV